MGVKGFKFEVEKQDLLTALRTVKYAANTKLYVLPNTCFVFRVKDDTMCVEAGNGQVVVKCTIPVVNSDEVNVTFVVSGRLIIDVLSQVENVTLKVNVLEYQVMFEHNYGSFSLPLCDVIEDYDKYNRIVLKDCSNLAMESPCLLSVLKKCSGFMDNNAIRPVMNGVLVDMTKEYTNFVASNACILIRVHKESLIVDNPAKIILPSLVVSMLLKLLPKTGFADVCYTNETDACKISFGNTEIIFRLICGRYPNYEQVIPQSFDYNVTVDRYELMGCLKRILPFTCDTKMFVMNVALESMMLTAGDLEENISISETLKVKYTEKSFVKGFDTKLFLECLNAVGSSSEMIINARESSSSAVIMTPVTQPSHETVDVLVMPKIVTKS